MNDGGSMETIFDLIYYMKKRPGNFIGNEITLKAIFHFLDGYIASAIIHKVLLDDEEKFRNQFDEWVRIKLIEQTGIQLDLHRSYYHYISTVYTDEQERIDSFFRLVHEFTESMNIVLRQNYR